MSEPRRPKWIKAPWCVVEDITLAFVCGRCRARLERPRPIRLSAYLKYADAFQEEHEFCKAEGLIGGPGGAPPAGPTAEG